MKQAQALRRIAILAAFASAFAVGCSGSGGGGASDSAGMVPIEGQTAYDLLVNRRDITINGGQIWLQGGFDLEGFNNELHEPLIIFNGNIDVGDYITTLRQIPAENVVAIGKMRASEVPPTLRRPGGCMLANSDGTYPNPRGICWASGVIEIQYR